MLLQVLAVIVPLLVAAVPLFRWPTLERRTRGHLALVKELPEGMGKEFRAVVEEELRELAHRMETRLAQRVEWLERGLRVAIVVFVLAVAVVAAVRAPEREGPWGNLWQGFVTSLGLSVALLVLGLLILIIYRLAPVGPLARRDHRERLWRKAKAESKTMLFVDGEYVLVDPAEVESAAGDADHRETGATETQAQRSAPAARS